MPPTTGPSPCEAVRRAKGRRDSNHKLGYRISTLGGVLRPINSRLNTAHPDIGWLIKTDGRGGRLKPLERFDAQHAKAFRDLDQAVALEHNELLAETDSACARVIHKNPQHFEALHLYGYQKRQARRPVAPKIALHRGGEDKTSLPNLVSARSIGLNR